jgi:hypothetical protein
MDRVPGPEGQAPTQDGGQAMGCVCVCVRERERKRETERQRERERVSVCIGWAELGHRGEVSLRGNQ